MTHWLPIESAPRDGSEVLACEGGRTMAVVAWLADTVRTEGWYISDGHNDAIWYRNAPYLTHWMPLPDPPGERLR